MASIESTQDLTQRMLGTLTSPNPGFWNCCQAKPSKAVRFDGDNGEPVWYQACAACASTVSAERIRELAQAVDLEREEGRALALDAAEAAVTSRLDWDLIIGMVAMGAAFAAVILALILAA